MITYHAIKNVSYFTLYSLLFECPSIPVCPAELPKAGVAAGSGAGVCPKLGPDDPNPNPPLGADAAPMGALGATNPPKPPPELTVLFILPNEVLDAEEYK